VSRKPFIFLAFLVGEWGGGRATPDKLNTSKGN
jgi:hypothetical protein